MLYWSRPFKTVRAGGFKDGDIVWFPEGGLNASYNCVDRWAHTKPDAVSLVLSQTLAPQHLHPSHLPAFAAFVALL